MAVADFLQDLGLFEGLSRSQLERIAAVCIERHYAPGEIIFAEYSKGDEMCFIKDGSILVQISTGSRPLDGQVPDPRTTIARLMPGHYVGEQVMVDDAMRSATVVSEGESVLLLMSRNDIERLCAEDTQLGYLFMRNIAQELSFKLRNTGLVMRGEIWSNKNTMADPGFGFENPTEVEA
ncbi:MAG TPA: cyclic nucleotide-binding domain-containing protein [Chloroflexia bacterium]|nr:cyclic nucleotide-binding domain-containing protein [Chloroflexia bacterium]